MCCQFSKTKPLILLPSFPPTIPPYTLDAPPFKLAFESSDDISSSNDDADMEDFVGNTGTGSSHFFQCFWRRQPLFGRLMMVFSLALIIFAILTCCFAICGNSTEGEKKSHLKEVCNSVHMETCLVPRLVSTWGPEKLPKCLFLSDEDDHSFQFFGRRTIELVCCIFFIRDSWNFFPCTHSHLSLFFHNLGIIKAPIPEAGSDARRCEGSTGVDIRVHPLPTPGGATGGQQEGGGNSDCYLNMCILELNTHLLVIYAHLFLHNNKAPSCLVLLFNLVYCDL